MGLWGGLWLADYVGSFLADGGNAVYYLHYLPLEMGAGHNGSQGTFNFFSADKDLKVKQPLAQYFASQPQSVSTIDGPPAAAILNSGPDTTFTLPPASITVVRGKVAMRASVPLRP